MGWIASLGVALLVGALALFGAGTVASLAVDWYQVSSFEGGAGFFVVAMALFGAIGGAILGLVVSRIEARQSRPRFVRALGASVGALLVILGAIAGGAWMLADIPPQIDGDELFLQAEIRWPASGTPAPNALDGVPYLRLGALSGSVVRRLEDGPLFIDDARQEDGRWILPGVVPIFTTRGGRLLDFGAGDRTIAGFVVPLPRRPGDAQRSWSAWLPAAKPGEPALPDQFTYRFKVLRRSEAVRSETIGPFEIDTVAAYFNRVGDSNRMAAQATFRVRYRGQPIAEMATANTVTVIGGAQPALLVTVAAPNEGPPCALLVDDEGRVRVQRLQGCAEPMTPRPLTNDRARFTSAASATRVPGWLDRTSLAEPGLYQIDALVLDTRTLTAASFLFPNDDRPDSSLPPLDLSPDEQSFAWWAQSPEEQPRLGVTNWQTNYSYILPIDRARMRYASESMLDPAWVRHHFAWTHDANGIDVLAERPDFTPLPYRGEVELGKPGDYQSYRLSPGGEPLRDALVDVLVADLGAERLPDPYEFARQVRLTGKTVNISVLGTPSYVSVSLQGVDGDPELMTRIAASLDAVLATGRYDALFVASKEAP